MLTEHDLRADDEKVPPRRWPQAIDPDPQHPIATAEPGVWVGTEGNPELVTEDEILEDEIASRSKPEEATADEQKEEFELPAG